MKALLTIFLLSVTNFSIAEPISNSSSQAIKIIKQVVEANGGVDNFYKKNGVSYTYLYRTPEGKVDLSEEKYIFDQEKSYARYILSEKLSDSVGSEVLTQYYDGHQTVAHLGDNVITDRKAIKRADFLRKTNYYWFAMMFKLLDQGTNYSYLGEYQAAGNSYHKIQLTYAQNVGDVSDKYLLFVNQQTNFIDFFLFTVMDFNVKDPLIMKVEYREVDNVLIPAIRRYTKAISWDQPQAANDQWVDEICLSIKFDD